VSFLFIKKQIENGEYSMNKILPKTKEYNKLVIFKGTFSENVQKIRDVDRKTIIKCDDMVLYYSPYSTKRLQYIPINGNRGMYNGASWSCSIKDDKLTLHPSINATYGNIKEHYFIKDNKVIWCQDSCKY
jgi:hypothetical protein